MLSESCNAHSGYPQSLRAALTHVLAPPWCPQGGLKLCWPFETGYGQRSSYAPVGDLTPRDYPGLPST